MAEGVGWEVWGTWPDQRDNPRVALWPEVNIVVPLHVEAEGDADLLAAKRVVLARVPVPGEHVEVAGRFAVVEDVRWASGQPPRVRTQALPAVGGLVDAIEIDGFQIVPLDDADDWLSGLTGE